MLPEENAMTKRTIRAILDDPFAGCDLLTDSERPAANLTAKGYTVRAIAKELGISENAVRIRLRTAMFKLGCRRKYSIVRRFVQELEDRAA